MYLHIGKGSTVREREIVGIFDLDAVSRSASGRKFLSRAEKRKEVCYGDDDLPRSFILTVKGDATRVHLSHISAVGLASRLGKDLEE